MPTFVFPGKDGVPIVVHTRPRGCDARDRKRLYETREEAQQAIAWERRNLPSVPKLYIYECRPCGGFHLTKQKRR